MQGREETKVDKRVLKKKKTKSGSWGEWRPLWLCGQDLHHSTVGIVGLGRIGVAVAQRLHGFDCKLLYTGLIGWIFLIFKILIWGKRTRPKNKN